MRIQPINCYSNIRGNNRGVKKYKYVPVNMTAIRPLPPEEAERIADLKVFHHHIYEFKKGIRTLILTTETSKHRETIEDRLVKENIDYVIRDVDENKINVFFGEKPCVDVIKTFDTKLNKYTPEQDFILGTLLGYDKVKQCVRYLDFKNRLKS